MQQRNRYFLHEKYATPDYRSIPGVAGVHLMAPLNESAVPEVIAAFRRKVKVA